MKQLKAFINKSNLSKVRASKFVKDKFLVIPYNDFYNSCKEMYGRPIENNWIDYWILDTIQLNKLFLTNKLTKTDIEEYNISIFPIDWFKGNLDKYLSSDEYLDGYTIGDVKPLSWKEVKDIWNL